MKKTLLLLLVCLALYACKKDYEADCSSIAGSYTITEVFLTNASGVERRPNDLIGRKLVLDNCESSLNKAAPKFSLLSDGGEGTYKYVKPNESEARFLTFSQITNAKDSAFANLFSTYEFGIYNLTDTTVSWECRNTDTKNYKGFDYRTSEIICKRRFP
jgi:hypothetical protein